MLRKSIEKLNETGVIVVSITSDNPTCNWKMYEDLGAKLYSDNPKVNLSLTNAINILIFVTLDACHLLKLARNCLGDFKSLVNSERKVISWRYIQELN